MPTDSQLSGASAPLEISGRVFHSRTLTDKDHDELNEYVQNEMIELARRSVSNLTPDERKEILGAAITEATGVTWNSEQGGRLMNQMRGFTRLAYQMIKHSINGGIDYPIFHQLFTEKGDEVTRANIEKVDTMFMKQNTSYERTEGSEVPSTDTKSE